MWIAANKNESSNSQFPRHSRRTNPAGYIQPSSQSESLSELLIFHTIMPLISSQNMHFDEAGAGCYSNLTLAFIQFISDGYNTDVGQ